MTQTFQTNITVMQDADGTMGIFTVHTENGKKVLTMGEYISREETIKRIKECYCTGCNSYNGVRCRACGTGDAIDMIEDTTAADVAPVVRCKYCKHSWEDIGGLTCSHGVCVDCAVLADFYCAYGERKDGADAEG